ncbi:MAG: 50S ribosomal protein L24 [Bacillota bacterium]
MAKGKLSVKKGDTVSVIAGKSKGKKGKVLRTEPSIGRVVVEGVNMVKKHQKPNQKIMQGGIIDKEAPIDVSNVMLVCKGCGKPTRTGHKELDNGKTVRFCRKCGEVIDK